MNRPTVTEAWAGFDFTVDISWSDGSRNRYSFAALMKADTVWERLVDSALFVNEFRLVHEGTAIQWFDDPTDCVDVCIDSLWFRAHPEAYRQQYPEYADHWPPADDGIRVVN